MDGEKDQLKELQLKIKKLERENRRLVTEGEVLKNLNEQVSRTQKFFHEENQRQLCYNNQLLKTSPYILVMVNEKLETVMASDVFFRTSGVSRDAVKEGMGLSEAFTGILKEEDLKDFLLRCERTLENQGTDSYLLTTDLEGQEKFFQVDICFYLAQAEDVRGLSIIFSDMTEIIEAKEKAENADKAKSNFLANMSHEIRTPMNAINGMAEFILRDSEDEEAKKNAAMIKSATKSLINIINDILDFSKIESGKMEIINDAYSLSSLVNDVATMIRIRLEDKKVSLKLNVDPELPDRLFGDEGRIKQILINLLNNAVKFTHVGEITLTMGFSRIEKEIEKEIEKDEYSGSETTVSASKKIRLLVAVKDTGIGIKKEELGKIFDSFTQADTKRNRSIEGTGLGLAICRKLTAMMGGELRVTSEYGKGSEFSFDIVNEVLDESPIGDLGKRTQNAHVDAYETQFYAPKARVLVVDDNKMNLKVAQGILKPYGILPDCVESGAEALIAAQKCEYDLIFMDHMMPVMDGVETMQKLRKMEDGETLKIVALTANALSGVEAKYKEAGFDGFLAKPIEPKEMAAVLLAMLPEEFIQNEDVSSEEGNSVEKENPAGKENSAQDDGIIEFIPDDDDDEILEFIPDDCDEAEESEADPTGEEHLLEELKALGINVDSGLHYAVGQKSFYLEMLRDYITEWGEKEEKLGQFLATSDWKSYEVLVHSLKSTSKTIGADDISAAARELELAATEKNGAFVRENHPKLMESGKSLVKNMKKLMDQE